MNIDELLQNYSADELIKLAEQKRREEIETKTSGTKQLLMQKQQEYKQMKLRHRKELAVVTKEIRVLQKKLRRIT